MQNSRVSSGLRNQFFWGEITFILLSLTASESVISQVLIGNMEMSVCQV